jgi:hypothetical protein
MMKNDIMENNLDYSQNRNKISPEKLLMGSISNKYPVVLNDGRTVVYISDKNREAEIRLKFELLKDKKYPSRSPRHHS